MKKASQVLRRVQQLSIDEVVERGSQKLWSIAERFALWRGTELGTSSGSASSHRPKPVFFSGALLAAGTGATLSQVAPSHIADVMLRAENIAAGMMPIFGLDWVNVGSPPQWHHEPVAGLTAPRRHWSQIPYLDVSCVGDHKILWEFNRHQHFVTLGQAWAITGDKRWSDLFALHVDSWIQENPVHVGVNWASSLEVSYRAISWCWALNLFHDSPALTDDRRRAMERMLHAHARHLTRYLSTYFSPNTHLTGEALGLYYLGTSLTAFTESTSWQSRGAAILNQQLPVQVHGDGVYFEQATQYHRYTAEIYLHYWILAEQAGHRLSADHRDRIIKVFDVLAALRRGDGTMPLLGDDDGGRLVQLDGDTPEKLDGLLAVAAATFDRPDWLRASSIEPAMMAWMRGTDGLAWLSDQSRSASVNAAPSVAFEQGGLFVMRGHGNGEHAVISCGPHGSLSCGHAHADALSLVLHDGVGELFSDAGTYTYMGPERNEFRGASGHNTSSLNQHADFVPAGPFSWSRKVDARHTQWAQVDGHAYFEGVCGEEPRSRRRRSVGTTRSGVWIVEDSCDAAQAQPAEIRWRLAFGLEGTVVESWDGGARVDLRRQGRMVASLVVWGEAGELDISPSWVSPQYGKRLPCALVRWRGELGCNRMVRSVVIVWSNTTGSSFRISDDRKSLDIASARGAEAGSSVRISFSNVIMPHLRVRADSDSLVTTENPETGAVSLVAFGVRALQLGDASVEGAAPIISAEFADGMWHTAPHSLMVGA